MRESVCSVRNVLFLLLTGCWLSFSSGVGWGQAWREVQSPHFRVVTDGSERDGRAVAKEFEQIRHVFVLRFNRAQLETGAPLLVVAVGEPGLHALGPQFWNERDRVLGQFIKGWEQQFALVRLDRSGDFDQITVFHEYAHSVLHANLHWLPTWLDEGMAEFYAYTRIEGEHTYIGAPSLRLRNLKEETPIPMAEMLVATSGTYAKDALREDLFYGEAWAAVHYMTFGRGMGNGQKLDQFIHLLETGKPQAAAFQQVFGDIKAFDLGLMSYVRTSAMTAAMEPPEPGLDAKTFSAKVLSPAEVDYELGSFEVGAYDRVTGRTRLEAAVTADPALAGAHEELGFLDLDQGRDEEAKQEWEKAVKLDPTRYRAAFGLIMTGIPLRQQSMEQLRQTQVALKSVIEKGPKFAPAFVELALVELRLVLLQDAYNHARAAEDMEPWRAGYHLLVGYILLKGHQPAIAGNYAQVVAARWSGSDHDEAVDLWNELPAGARGEGAALKLSLPSDATLIRGTIVSTSCEKSLNGNRLNVVLQPAAAGSATLKLTGEGRYESGFSDTLWFGKDHYTSCYHLGGLPALVAYRPDGAVGGKMLAFEVRDDLPGNFVTGTKSTEMPQTSAQR